MFETKEDIGQPTSSLQIEWKSQFRDNLERRLTVAAAVVSDEVRGLFTVAFGLAKQTQSWIKIVLTNQK